MNNEERLAELLIDPALADTPLAALCTQAIADQKRLHQRLDRISRISDGYQAELKGTNRDLAESNEKLASALSDIRTLRGFIPICSKCKRVRDDGGYWDEVETYLTKNSDAVMGPSVCPACTAGEGPHSAHMAVAASTDADADAEQLRLAGILEDSSLAANPLRDEYERLSLGFQKLVRRLNKISRISDGFQTQLKHLNAALATASRTDPLTSLPNRRAMLERLEQVATAAANEGPGFALAMVDIDHFKRINDSFGHAVGDAVLRALADRLQALLGNNDYVARWGGEEFLLLIARADIAAVRELCERVRAAIEVLRIEHHGRYIGCTVSIGIAMHERVLSFEDTIRDADRALYAAKSYGRNTVTSADDL